MGWDIGSTVTSGFVNPYLGQADVFSQATGNGGLMSQNRNGQSIPYTNLYEQYQASKKSRDNAYQTGLDRGKELFVNDPDMQMLRKRREDLSHGMDGQELGALRETARNEVAGQRGAYMRQLQSKVGRAGVGGARAAAMGAAADEGFLRSRGDAERKLAVENANLTRQGVGDLQDYIMRQKFGVLSSATGEQGLDVADRTGYLQAQSAQDAARAANVPKREGLFGQIFGGLF